LVSNCIENILKYKCCYGNDAIHEITLKKILKGGLPLRFGNSKNINWKISLERKNTKLGYNAEHVFNMLRV